MRRTRRGSKEMVSLKRRIDPERERLAAFVVSQADAMMGMALRYTTSRADAEDICQQAAISIGAQAERLSGLSDREVRAYLLSAVRNAAISELRRRKTQPATVPLQEDMVADWRDQPDSALLEAASMAAIDAAYARLSEADRDVLRMKCFDEMDDEAIAAIYGITPATVRSRLSRARKRLRALLKEEDIDV